MASYRRRLETDLDAWIAAGLVPAANREPILSTVKVDRRLDAATALAAIGAFLAGAAVIAFVAANWDEIPRIARFALVLAAFLAAALGGAWAAGRERNVTKNVLLSIASLVFAAAIGLTGQIFDIAGDPATALRGAGLGALALAIAGRSPWAAAAGVLLVTWSDTFGFRALFGDELVVGWAIFAAMLGVALAILWRSRPLAHAAGVAAMVGVFSIHWGLDHSWRLRCLIAAGVFAALAAGVRFARPRLEPVAGELFGWAVLGTLAYFGAAGMGDHGWGVAHAVAMLVISAAAVALGRHDASAAVTGIGVISLIVAGMSLLFALGIGLLTSAAVFAACAIAALAVALALRRRRAA